MHTSSDVRLCVDATGSRKLPADASVLTGKHNQLNPTAFAHHLLSAFVSMLQARASSRLMQRQQQASLRVQRSTPWWGPTLVWARALT
jgi:hypothetical protein